ncbi:hypothetical protein Megvenef_01663 [Candidatus Megaera venefica]|uniref:DUF1640 domain-containing protein n=1 Tax=Candidatus Megaera venefica TaxID=2055910 RepID=A0ABU5NEU7_9RICK|nr:hypothetical protein [Candidatus Megaera venefica]MEA0971679.1 hypothetical protein [Candidatus Megaera venefica]
MTRIDTHAIIEELIASGALKKQAEVCVARFVLRNEIEDLERRLATKSDLSQLRAELKSDLVKLESKIDGIESRLESKIDKLESKLDSGFNSINTNLKWISFIGMAIFGPITVMLIKDLFF